MGQYAHAKIMRICLWLLVLMPFSPWDTGIAGCITSHYDALLEKQDYVNSCESFGLNFRWGARDVLDYDHDVRSILPNGLPGLIMRRKLLLTGLSKSVSH